MDMLKTSRMTEEQQEAYEWAKNQNYQSVAARYAKLLADYITECISVPENKPLTWDQVATLKPGTPIIIIQEDQIQSFVEFGLDLENGYFWGYKDIVEGKIKVFVHKPEQEGQA